MARVLRALSNPHRLEIFIRLGSWCDEDSAHDSCGGPCACVGDLAQGLGIAPSTVSHHLSELRNAGLIRMEKRGRHVVCSLDRTFINELVRLLGRESGCSSR